MHLFRCKKACSSVSNSRVAPQYWSLPISTISAQENIHIIVLLNDRNNDNSTEEEPLMSINNIIEDMYFQDLQVLMQKKQKVPLLIGNVQNRSPRTLEKAP